ncbi:MAG: alpha/beta fold hydrolase [Chitinophagaceae bacterium]
MKIFLLSFMACFFCLPSFSQAEGRIDSDGSKLFYRVYGSGEPLLIINGGPGMNSDGFAGLAMILSKKYKTIIYDQRGTGRSVLKTTDSSTITIDLMIKDIENLRQYLHIDKWNILGHSFGGMLASWYATLYPGHIRSLILSSSGGIDLGLLGYVSATINSKLAAAERESVNYWTNKINGGDTSHYARLQRGLALAPAYVFDKKNVPVIAERLTQGNSRINNLVWQNLQKIKFDCATKLSAAVFPVLIIQGKQDIVSAATAEKAHKAFINSTLVFLDHSVHYGWLDNPVSYFEAVNDFLSKTGRN